VDFCVTCAAKIPIIRHPRTFGSRAVCRVKNRLAGDFLGFMREAQQTAGFFI
jgi:hypothetical protein